MAPIIFDESSRSHASSLRPMTQSVKSLQRHMEAHASPTALGWEIWRYYPREASFQTSFNICHDAITAYIYTRWSGRCSQDGIVISMTRSGKSHYWCIHMIVTILLASAERLLLESGNFPGIPRSRAFLTCFVSPELEEDLVCL